MRKLIQRLLLLVAIPVVVILSALSVYMQMGRFETTDNAYIKSHIANLSTEVQGAIIEIGVEENQRVTGGEVLLRLDEELFRLALQGAEARLAEVAASIESDRRAYAGALAEIELHESNVEFTRTQLARQEKLVSKNLGRDEDLDSARHELTSAGRRLAIAHEEAAELLAGLNGNPAIPLEEHPAWLSAKTAVEKARLDLAHTVLRAPFAGRVANVPEPGSYAMPFMPIIALVAEDGVWVEANFKETQMTHIREGQAVELTVDAYPGVTWSGEVESISGSTGAEFALLPPQNATGNWVKIVQRVPVRIDVQNDHPGMTLRAGMSCEVSVDTSYERQWSDLNPF